MFYKYSFTCMSYLALCISLSVVKLCMLYLNAVDGMFGLDETFG